MYSQYAVKFKRKLKYGDQRIRPFATILYLFGNLTRNWFSSITFIKPDSSSSGITSLSQGGNIIGKIIC